MLEKPILSNLSEKTKEKTLIGLVILMYVTMCAEADMYVPAFPEMIKYFGVGENKIQLILGINFAGLCVAGLFVGPLSDAFGRRIVLLGGLFLFAVSSYGCVYATSFISMIFWRLLQGVFASVPMVVGAVMFFDKYSSDKAGQLIGLCNSVITASIAFAPIVGAFLAKYIGWRANFVTIFILAILCLVGAHLFIEETLQKEKRKDLNLASILTDYSKLSSSFIFMGYCFIVNFPFNVIIVYISNLSVIFVNHMGISLEIYSLYQALTMIIFVISSIYSIKIITLKGLDYTKNLGLSLSMFGSILLYFVSAIVPESAVLICLAMAFVAAGGALMAGTFSMKALELFPDMKRTAISMMFAMSLATSAFIVILSGILFDGTIVPVAEIIFAYALISLMIFVVINSRALNTKA